MAPGVDRGHAGAHPKRVVAVRVDGRQRLPQGAEEGQERGRVAAAMAEDLQRRCGDARRSAKGWERGDQGRGEERKSLARSWRRPQPLLLFHT